MRLTLSAALAVAATLSLSSTAGAASTPLNLADCRPTEGVYQCTGLAETWDGVPLDTAVTLPSSEARGLPLVVELHGFGNSRYEYLDPASTAYTDNAFAWARDGYAVLTFTARGLWGSCGTPESRLASPVGCADGYIHLADVRYEVRDAQHLIGLLVDDGTADARRIGVTGDSYGGGQSLAMAALSDRTMLPDGTLVPWRSPGGTPLRLAAAAPVIPWSDLVTAAAPNGRVSPTGVTGRRRATVPVGIQKATVVNAIFAAAQFATGPGQPVGQPFVPGRPMGFLAPGTDPEADVAGWVTRTGQGEPYTDERAVSIVDQLARYHSPFYIDSGHRPPPLFLGSGFTDDLFPVDEVLRFANRTNRLYPGLPTSLLLGDFGHQRAANKPADRSRLLSDIHAWFDHYVRGDSDQPRGGATAFVQTCPQEIPSLGPFHAKRFSRLARGELRAAPAGAQTITSGGGDPRVGVAIDPVAGQGDSCVQTASEHAPGTARYTLKAAGAPGATLIGAPRLSSRVTVRGADPHVAQIAARLWDVAPDGSSQRLVARGSYRPEQGRNVWHLHPGAWRFRRSHAAEIELLGSDPPFSRPSNGSFEIEVRRFRARLPIRARR